MSGRCPCCGHGLTRCSDMYGWEIVYDSATELSVRYAKKDQWVVKCSGCGFTVSCDMKYKDIIDKLTGRDI